MIAEDALLLMRCAIVRLELMAIEMFGLGALVVGSCVEDWSWLETRREGRGVAWVGGRAALLGERLEAVLGVMCLVSEVGKLS